MQTREEKLQKKREYYYKNRDKCLAKQKETKKAWYERNKEKLKQVAKQWRLDNLEKCKETKKKWSEKNKDKLKKYHANWSLSNRDKLNSAFKKWKANNKDKVRYFHSKRRAYLLNAIPSWATKEMMDDIQTFYVCSQMFSIYTGEKYHVDHIIPLKGKNVSGLHVPNNLQILPAKENLKKRNSFN